MEMNRRDFLKAGTVSTGSFVVAFTVPMKSRIAMAAEKSEFPTHYFEIQPNNQFLFTMDKAEMGQGVISGQTTIFGDEADIDPQNLQVRTAPVADIYGTLAGQQLTGGSTSTKERWMVLREAGAYVRNVMKKAAAEKWGVKESEVRTENGYVFRQSGEKLSYGDLISMAQKVSLKVTPALKSKNEFRYIGKRNMPNWDAKEKSTGVREFGIDFSIPDLQVGVVVRCPTFGGKVKSFNADECKKSVGVVDVFPIFSGIAIVAEKYWQAQKARSVLKVEWDLGENAKFSSEETYQAYKKKIDNESGSEVESRGDVEQAFKEADEVVEAEFELPYLAHATMEPMNAAAHVQKNRCDIWSPVQGPTLVRNAAAKELGLSRDQVFVHTTKYLGGGFGRRSTLDYSAEAIAMSKKTKKPVKVIWSREDDTKHSPMRPISFHKFKASLKGGKITAWKHDLGCESIMQQVLPGWLPLMLPGWVPGFVGRGMGSVAGGLMSSMNFSPTTAEGAVIPYKVKNLAVEHHRLGLDIPIHFWRSVGHSYNGFVVESFFDELAVKLGQDPFDLRKKLIPNESRLHRVLDEVIAKSNYRERTKAGAHLGLASHFSFDSYVAQLVEVEVEGSKIRVKDVHCAVDCGVAVNPEIIEKQMESGIIYGLSAALHGEITFQDGQIQQDNFDTYPPLRLDETPNITVHIVDSEEAPTGVGEPGLPPIGAALANAVFRATGQRLRRWPLRLSSQNA